MHGIGEVVDPNFGGKNAKKNTHGDENRKIRKWGPQVNNAYIQDNGEVYCQDLGQCTRRQPHLHLVEYHILH
jgi:hypothetical protein